MPMATVRRKGAENSETRTQLVQLALQILREEGAAAVTAGRLAEQIGLRRHIVHYYFGTIDELFGAVIREEGERTEDWLKVAISTRDPLNLLWDLSRNSATIILELTSMAMRCPGIAKEYKIYTERFRQVMAEILMIYAGSRGLTLPASATATALILQSMACTIAIEISLGLTLGHEEAEGVLRRWLESSSPMR
jgi:TetR/AcrR family transcriptional regulator